MAGITLSSLLPKILHFDGLIPPRRASRFRVRAKTVFSILLENDDVTVSVVGDGANL